MKIKIKQSEIDKTLANDSYVDKDEIELMINVIEGINAELRDCGWNEGYRNDIAVDFTICCWYLGLDGKKIFEEMYECEDHRGYPLLVWVDTQDFNERYDTVMYYCQYQWNNPYGKDINMYSWATVGESIKPEDRVCVIVDDSDEAVTE